MLPSVRVLSQLGFELYASKGTAEFYNGKKIKVFFIIYQFIFAD